MKPSTLAKWRQYLAVFVANLGSFCIGMSLGWVSPMQPLLESADNPVGERPLTREEVSWIGSINFIGGIAGSFFWGKVSDRVGRKVTSILIGFPFALGWIIVLFAPNVYAIYIGRVIMGVACSGVIINTPMFTTEISEDSIRGTLGSFLMFLLNLGCLFCYVLGAHASFQVVTSICFVVPVIYSFIFLWIPETPIYLNGKNKIKEAEDSLFWYRGGDSLKVAKEMSTYHTREKKRTSLRDLCRCKGTIKALLIGFGFVFGQQYCGILAILTYSVTIFKEAGSDIGPYQAAIIVGCLQLGGSLISSILVDKAGRRVLLTTSFSVMAVALFLLSSYYTFKESLEGVGWLPVVSLSAHVVAYSIGGGPLPFVVMAEMFPPTVRGTALSLIQILNTSLSFATVKLFPTMVYYMGSSGTFLFYGSCCVLLTVFIIGCVPETKGKSLQDVLRDLTGVSNDDPVEQMCDKQLVAIIKTNEKETPVRPQLIL